ncbi:sugar-binding domain-containing protein [Specibacter cremeus]|uniref:sugar-binding domain-containing protein n=1 Tax=Specibacter cremeus TaxID=1629051 RepID=UPI00197BF1E8|nr:sugar-binding domain-containing protein [Specibacter cremeus]
MSATTGDVGRPESRFAPEVLYEAARMYYMEDANQAAIAAAMKVSRPTVSRLLTEARRIGMVRIEVLPPAQTASDALAAELASALGVDKAYLAEGDLANRIGPGFAPMVGVALREMGLMPGDVLLAASGRTLYELSRSELPQLPGVVVVPTVGGQAEPEPWHQTNEIARAVAERTGAHPAFVWAQALPTAEMFQMLQRDPDFQRIQRLWASAKGAVVGVGAPPTTRGSISRFIPREDNSLARAAGDVCLNFFDLDGNEVRFPGSEYMVGIRPAALQAIPHSVAVAAGQDKVGSIVGGARARLFKRLVTDTRTARSVLDLLADAAA